MAYNLEEAALKFEFIFVTQAIVQIITRQRSENDERKVIVELTKKRELLQTNAAEIPEKRVSGLITGSMNMEEWLILKINSML